MKKTKWRKTEVLQDGVWASSDLASIKAGDTFRLFEEDGLPVKDGKGRTEFQALEDAVPCPPAGNWSVVVEK